MCTAHTCNEAFEFRLILEPDLELQVLQYPSLNVHTLVNEAFEFRLILALALEPRARTRSPPCAGTLPYPRARASPYVHTQAAVEAVEAATTATRAATKAMTS